MKPRLQKACLVLLDLCLAVYLVLAFSAFNKPEEKHNVCRNVDIVIADASTHGFIDSKEVKNRLEKMKLYPKGKMMRDVDCRRIEETLLKTPFVKSAECYKDQQGTVTVSISQLMPVIRIKAINNDDFYIDDKDCVMPKSDYTSDLIIATGYISRSYATQYLGPFARALMADDVSRNLVEQINITKDLSVELITRLGDHVVCLGRLPECRVRAERHELIAEFVKNKMQRLQLFYKYGLPTAGWNKYSEIDLEYDNQIICKRIDEEEI